MFESSEGTDLEGVSWRGRVEVLVTLLGVDDGTVAGLFLCQNYTIMVVTV